MTAQYAQSKQYLRWQCRRGLLELDYVLENYLSNRFDTAPDREQAQFTRLLKQQDSDIQAWLFGAQQPAPGFALIVQQLRYTV